MPATKKRSATTKETPLLKLSERERRDVLDAIASGWPDDPELDQIVRQFLRVKQPKNRRSESSLQPGAAAIREKGTMSPAWKPLKLSRREKDDLLDAITEPWPAKDESGATRRKSTKKVGAKENA